MAQSPWSSTGVKGGFESEFFSGHRSFVLGYLANPNISLGYNFNREYRDWTNDPNIFKVCDHLCKLWTFFYGLELASSALFKPMVK